MNSSPHSPYIRALSEKIASELVILVPREEEFFEPVSFSSEISESKVDGTCREIQSPWPAFCVDKRNVSANRDTTSSPSTMRSNHNNWKVLKISKNLNSASSGHFNVSSGATNWRDKMLCSNTSITRPTRRMSTSVTWSSSFSICSKALRRISITFKKLRLEIRCGVCNMASRSDTQ